MQTRGRRSRATTAEEDLLIAVYLAITSALVLGGGDIIEASGQIGISVGFILALLRLVTFGTGFFQRFLDADTNESIVVRALGVSHVGLVVLGRNERA